MVITVSRQAECGGEEVVERVAQWAGLRVADRAIVEQMAEQEGMPLAHVARYDEVAVGLVEALIVEWQTSLSRERYVRRLALALLALERQGNVIIVGRGAAFVLTDPGTLHVRIIAPMAARIARLVKREGIASTAAERLLRRIDEQRRRFVQQTFGADIDSPLHYDLVINTAELSVDAAAEVILQAARRKSLSRGAGQVEGEVLTRLPHSAVRMRLARTMALFWEWAPPGAHQGGR